MSDDQPIMSPDQVERSRAKNLTRCRRWYKANQAEEQRKARERASATDIEIKRARQRARRSTPEGREKHAAEARDYRARNRAKVLADRKAYYHANRDARLAYRIKNKYGLGAEAFAAMIEAQENRCLCCKTQFGLLKAHRPFVDHCHSTGRVRGILCNQCNALLGNAHDSPEVLRMCAAYLECATSPAGSRPRMR